MRISIRMGERETEREKEIEREGEITKNRKKDRVCACV
jgi:hypothetical protein